MLKCPNPTPLTQVARMFASTDTDLSPSVLCVVYPTVIHKEMELQQQLFL